MFPVQSENEILKAQIYRTELDLEISLRERLQKTIEGRIQWATLLQTALTSECELQTMNSRSHQG